MVKNSLLESLSAPSEMVSGQKGEEINRFLEPMEEALFSGAVLVQQAGVLLVCKGYGQAAKDVPNTSLTIFHAASITKQFTAAAVMLLVEEEKIDLDASINEYLPTRFCTEEWDAVTVNHLLNHTSGIPNYADWDDYWDICEHLTIDKVIKDVQEQGLEFPPGESYNYSNTGYTILGKIIEKQGNMPYHDFIKKRLLEPAGMTSSGIHEKSNVPDASCCATGLCIDNQKLTKDKRDEFSILFSDGGLYTTIKDMAKWSIVLDGKTDVLSQKSVKMMIHREYGLMADKLVGHRRIHHNGSMAGFRSDFCKYPDEDLLIVVLGNNADFVVEYLSSQIARYLFEPNYQLPKVIPYPSQFDYKPYTETTFQSREEGEKHTFKQIHDKLTLSGDPPAICYLLSNNRLFLPSVGQELALQSSGKIFLYDDEGEKVDVLAHPTIFTKIFHLIKNYFN